MTSRWCPEDPRCVHTPLNPSLVVQDYGSIPHICASAKWKGGLVLSGRTAASASPSPCRSPTWRVSIPSIQWESPSWTVTIGKLLPLWLPSRFFGESKIHHLTGKFPSANLRIFLRFLRNLRFQQRIRHMWPRPGEDRLGFSAAALLRWSSHVMNWFSKKLDGLYTYVYTTKKRRKIGWHMLIRAKLIPN